MTDVAIARELLRAVVDHFDAGGVLGVGSPLLAMHAAGAPSEIEALVELREACAVSGAITIEHPAATRAREALHPWRAATWNGTEGDAVGRAVCRPGAWGGPGCLAHEGHDIGDDGRCIEGRGADDRPAILRLPPGLHRSVTPLDYYARVPGVASKSTLDLLRPPARYRAWLAGELPDDTTPAKAFGQALHCAILEPERFTAAYAVPPKVDRRTKEGKATWAAWLADHPGVMPLDAEDARAIAGMACGVIEHDMADALLTGGEREVTARWRDPSTGIECKARFDSWSEDIVTIVDVKTCEDASPEAFARAVAKYGLHRQAAMYLDACAALGFGDASFVLAAIEKAPPYAVAVYQLDDDALAKGRSSIRRDLETFARCLESDVWPGYAPGVERISLPAWATW